MSDELIVADGESPSSENHQARKPNKEAEKDGLEQKDVAKKESAAVPREQLLSCGSMVCRICQTNSNQEVLISPCHCKGSMAYVHLSCLQRWLNQSSRRHCELCMYHFDAEMTRRYGLCEGLRLWLRHPRNRNHIQSDIVIGGLLTAITVGLVAVSLLGLQYFVEEAKKLGISRVWTQNLLIGFICIVILSYVITIYLLIKDQVVPWYAWWTNTVDVRLLLNPSVASGVHRQLSNETNNILGTNV